MFAARVDNFYSMSGRCPRHRRAMSTTGRPRYGGAVPDRLRRPIRAGLLQGVPRAALVETVAALLEHPAGDGALVLAEGYMAEIERARYDRVVLLDSAFWWDDTNRRRGDRRYTRPCKRPRLPSGGGAAGVVVVHQSPTAARRPADARAGSAMGADPRVVPVGDGGAPAAAPPGDAADVVTFEMSLVGGLPVPDHPDANLMDEMCLRYLRDIRADIVGDWPNYAARYLRLPFPLGGRRLCAEHLRYCRSILMVTANKGMRIDPDSELFRAILDHVDGISTDPSVCMDVLRDLETKAIARQDGSG